MTTNPISPLLIRTLGPCVKKLTLLDCFDELEADVAIITETWFTSGSSLDKDIEDLRLGSGLGLLVRNRDPGARGHSHGGVGIAFRSSMCTFRHLLIHNPDNFEVLAAIGTCLLYTSPSPRDS